MNRIVAISLAALIAGPALADGPAPVIVAAPVIAPASDWTGGYVGLSVGTGQFDAEYQNQSVEEDLTGYGLFAGYNYQMGRTIVGAELSHDWLDFDDIDDDDASITRLMLRVGMDAGKVFPYVTAGFAKADFDDVSDDGYAYGIGADFMPANNFVVGAQFLKHEFDDFDDSGVDFDAGMFSIRAAYKF